MKIYLIIIILIFSNKIFSQTYIGDCNKGIILCSKKSLLVKNFNGPGNYLYENGATSCSNYFEETNSTWIKWNVAKSGKLWFTITPLDEDDDIDFILYKIPNGVYDCSQKIESRCMASGRLLGSSNTDVRSLPCKGATGLWEGSGDFVESEGCNYSKDNFLESIELEKGSSYALFINNYNSNIGFTIEWGGDCEFSNNFEIPSLKSMENWNITNNVLYLDKKIVSSRWETRESENNRNLLYSKNTKSSSYYSGEKLNGLVYSGCKELNTKKIIIPERVSNIIEEPAFGEPYPNPTVYQSNLIIHIPTWMEGSELNVDIENIMGGIVKSRKIALINKGQNVVELDLYNLPAGLYNIVLNIKGYKSVKKIAKIVN